MKQSIGSNSNRLWRLGVLGGCASVLIAACERPDFTFSDDVPISGAGFGGSIGVGGAPVTGGSSTGEACQLELVSGTPALARQAVSHQLPARPEVYLQLTDAEVTELKRTRTLLPASQADEASSVLSVLNQLLSSTDAAQQALVSGLVERFRVTRSAWPNPWALRLIDHAGSEHMNPVRLRFKKEAWILRVVGGTVAVIDTSNGGVPLDRAAAAPERVAAVYYVLDDRTLGMPTSCENGKRELALGNEAMVEEFSLGTPEILDRLDADIAALGVVFNAARPCSSIDKGGQTFHANTVCTAWRFFDTSTHYLAYQWSLSNPMELYKPTPQNLSNLIEALQGDRFEPDPFVAEPRPRSVTGTTGEAGAGGAGGASGAADAGASSGGASEGGASAGGASEAGSGS